MSAKFNVNQKSSIYWDTQSPALTQRAWRTASLLQWHCVAPLAPCLTAVSHTLPISSYIILIIPRINSSVPITCHRLHTGLEMQAFPKPVKTNWFTQFLLQLLCHVTNRLIECLWSKAALTFAMFCPLFAFWPAAHLRTLTVTLLYSSDVFFAVTH
jgi:hypothetical protein